MKWIHTLTGKATLATVMLLFGQNLMGQTVQSASGAAFKTEVRSQPREATVVLREAVDLWNPYMKTTKRWSEPLSDVEQAEVDRMTAQMKAEREAWVANGGPSQKTAMGNPPVQGTNFVGNTYNNFAPTDNTIAINSIGQMISGTNARLHTFDSTGASLGATTLNGFFAGLSGLPQFKFDPKVIHDPAEDRFVVLCLAAFDSINSRIVIGFSQTNDPSGNYNLYQLDGNPFNNGLWTDFPNAGLNNDELFITGNLFTDANNPVYNETAIWQIDKYDGYAGNSLDFVVHSSPNFTSIPVQGAETLYGPNMYFVNTLSGDANTIFLQEIDNTIANNGSLSTPSSFTISPSMGFATTIDQPSPGQAFTSPGSRIRDAYFANSRIEFVLGSSLNGRSAVYHGTGFISPFGPTFSNFTGEYISYPDIEVAYPSITYAGEQASSGRNHSFICFNYASPTVFPSNGVCYSDENGVSDYTTCRQGLSYIIPIGGGQPVRWGDYTEIALRPGHPGEAWMAASYGNSSRREVTHISQIMAPLEVSNDLPEPVPAGLEIAPNPASERVMFFFPVEEYGRYDLVVRDLQGREIKRWQENTLRIGEATLHFGTEALSNGVYMVTVENENGPIFTEKFVVNK